MNILTARNNMKELTFDARTYMLSIIGSVYLHNLVYVHVGDVTRRRNDWSNVCPLEECRPGRRELPRLYLRAAPVITVNQPNGTVERAQQATLFSGLPGFTFTTFRFERFCRPLSAVRRLASSASWAKHFTESKYLKGSNRVSIKVVCKFKGAFFIL